MLFLLYLIIVLKLASRWLFRPKNLAKCNLIVIIVTYLIVCCVFTVLNILYMEFSNFVGNKALISG